MSRNSISDEKIITRPNSVLALWANIFVIFIILFVILLTALVGTNVWTVLIPTIILIIAVIASLNSFSKKVIFDRNANKVSVKSLLLNKDYEPSDIHSVSKVNSTGAKDYYILTTKSDPFGQGIKLTNKVAFGNEELEDFEKNILPGIRTFIEQPQNIVSESRFAAPDSTQFSMYKRTDSGYYFYDANTLLIVIGIALFGWSLWAIYNFDFNNLNVFLQNPKYPTPLFKFISPLLLPLSLAIFGRGVLRIRLAPNSGALTREYFFGAFKKNYKLKIPVECFIQSNRQNGRHTETDVRISVENNKENSIILRHFYKTKDVEKFIAETKKIFNSTLPN